MRTRRKNTSDETVEVSADFPSRTAAHKARDRLVRAGFARNSIDIDPHGEGYAVSISTREENSGRADRILNGGAVANDLRHGASAAVDVLNGNRALSLGLAALAGFALYSLTTRR